MGLDGQSLKQYRILRQLGAGGMGEVYLAEDTVLERQVAIKVIKKEVAGEGDQLRRFLREAKATSALNHPAIAQIYGMGEDEGMHFLVLEYIPGQTLRELEAAGPISLERMIEIAIDIASALAAAESSGIVHRDLKPANIMISDSGQTKVLDLGLAKVQTVIDDRTVTEITREGAVVGTMAYMSPEQALGHDLDYRSDIFSLGVILYEMAARQHPFNGQTATELLVNIVHQTPAPLQLNDPVEGARFASIIGRCLEKDRERRYPSAAVLLKDLQQLRLERLIRESQASMPPLPAGVLAPTRRHTLVWAAGAAAVAATAGAYAGYRWLAADSVRSIAVLPFENQTGDAKLDYVAGGLTTTLIDDLSRLPHMRVMSYEAVQPFKGKPVDSQTAGTALKVAAMLKGQLMSDGASMRVQVDLVDVRSGAELWGHAYNQDLQRLLSIQQEISREVSEQLGVRRQRTAARAPSEARERAYDLCLQASYALHEPTAESAAGQAALLRQAIQDDPSYALPHVYLSYAYLFAMNAATRPATELLPQARDEALKALALDRNSPDAHAVLGFTEALDFDWSGAEGNFKQSQALNPNLAQAHYVYAVFVLTPRGQVDAALAEVDRALDVNPRSNVARMYKGLILYCARRYTDAERALQDAIAGDPSYFFHHFTLGQVYVAMKRFPEAIEQLNMPPYRTGGNTRQLVELTRAYAAAGDRKRLAPLLEEIEERKKNGYIAPFGLARLYAAMGDQTRAFAALERAYQERDQGMAAVKSDPALDALRGDSRFHELLRKMNLEN